MSGAPAPERGAVLRLPLTAAPGDEAQVRILADLRRDVAPHIDPSRADPLRAVAGGVLVEVHAGGRMVLPGTWASREALEVLEPAPGPRPRLRAADLRMPAVVLGDGPAAVLAWGETIWPLPFDGSASVPASCRPAVHGRADLRRLVLAALGRIDEVGLTLWSAPGFEVPWHDVRLVPRARWWFAIAQVPAGMRYADAARAQGVDVERLLDAPR